ncbi:zinc-dependent alcohol dehydrogenase [Nesterenkonia alba]|uniref:zinc-dependent alcohol dehydrogenase n=1 Tax=Nesterenkonia alba TaxID=515814 RepID=UPI0003B7304F|nr:zinc-binding dehydrogenase [Nesterenkonia alba]
MRALVLEDFGRLAVHDVPKPQLQAGHVLLRIIAVGICGSDLHGFTGENGRRHPGQIMGHEAVGRIAELGEGVNPADFPLGAAATFNPVVVPEDQLEDYRGREQQAPGKTVLGVHPHVTAAFAEYISVPARNVILVGEEVHIDYGALIEPLAVAAHAVTQAGIHPGDRVLIVGGGPIGQSVIVAAQQAGADSIIVSELDPRRRDLCAQLGAMVLDPAGATGDQLLETPADVTVDAVGVTTTLRQALRSTRDGGTVCLVGMGTPTVEISAYAISTEERALVGSFTYTAEDFRRAAEWVAQQVTDFAPLLSATIPMEEAQAEFTRQAAGEVAPGKVLIRISEQTREAP